MNTKAVWTKKIKTSKTGKQKYSSKLYKYFANMKTQTSKKKYNNKLYQYFATE